MQNDGSPMYMWMVSGLIGLNKRFSRFSHVYVDDWWSIVTLNYLRLFLPFVCG